MWRFFIKVSAFRCLLVLLLHHLPLPVYLPGMWHISKLHSFIFFRQLKPVVDVLHLPSLMSDRESVAAPSVYPSTETLSNIQDRYVLIWQWQYFWQHQLTELVGMICDKGLWLEPSQARCLSRSTHLKPQGPASLPGESCWFNFWDCNSGVAALTACYCQVPYVLLFTLFFYKTSWAA